MKKSDIENIIKKERHIIRKIAIIVFSVWAVFELILLLLATPILKSKLKQIVETESKGVYTISFDYISVEPLSVSFRLINFKLSADTARYNQLKKNKEVRAALYEISFESLNLHRLHILQFLRKDKLEFKKLEINKPNVNVLAIPTENDTISYDAVHTDIYASIKPYADELVIKKIILDNGHFNLKQNQTDKTNKSSAEEITVYLYNFKLDSVSYYKKTKLFYSDSLNFAVRNYKLKLDDGIHNVSAENTLISLGDSSITVKNAHIYPDKNAEKKHRNKSLYNIKAPSVKLTGIDVYKAWFNKEITVNTVKFDSAKIFITNPAEKPDTTKELSKSQTDYKNLYPLIRGKLSSVKVDNFDFTNAFFELKKSNRITPSYTIEKLNFSLKNFQLDSLAFNTKNKILYADNFDMDVQNYKMKFYDETHKIEIDQLYLSTEKKVIFAVNINILPEKTNESKIDIKIKIPFFRLNNADFIKAYSTGELNIGEMISDSPEIKIIKNFSDQKKNNTDADFIYNIVAHYLGKVTIDKLILERGKLSFTDNSDIEKHSFVNGIISMHLSDFLLDENTATQTDRIFYASGFNISLNNFSYKPAKDLHIITASKISASTFNSTAEILNFEYKPSDDTLQNRLLLKYNKNSLKQFKIEKLLFSNIDIKKAVFGKKLFIDKIYMKSPFMSIKKYAGIKNSEKLDTVFADIFSDTTSFKQVAVKALTLSDSVKSVRQIIVGALSDKLNEISVGIFKIDSGHFEMSDIDTLNRIKSEFKTNMTSSVELFYFNKDSIYEEKPLFSGKTKIEFSDLEMLFPEKFHKIKIKKINFNNKDSSLTANYVRVFPDISYVKNKIPTEYMFFSKQIFISGIDIEKLLNKKGINIREIYVTEPYVSLGFNKKLIDEKNKTKIKHKKRDINELKTIPLNIGKIKVDNGRAELYSIIDSIDNMFFKTEFDIVANSAQTISTQFDPEYFLNYNYTKLSLKKIQYLLPDSIHAVMADSVLLDLKNGNALIFNSNYSIRDDRSVFDYLKNKEKSGSLNFAVQKIYIQGLNIVSLALENKLFLDKISIVSPYFLIEKYRKNKEKIKLSFTKIQENIYKILTKNIEKIQLKKIEIRNAKINFKDKTSAENSSEEISKIYADIFNFNIQRNYVDTKNILFSDDIKLKIEDYKYEFTEKYYKLNVKQISLSTKGKSVLLDSVSYVPVIDKYLYALKIGKGKQKSAVFIKNASVSVNNFDFYEFLSTNNISAQNIEIKNLKMYVFKDMHLPEDSLKRHTEPWLLIKKYNKNINIKNIDIKNSEIIYEQNSPKHDPTGILTLSEINGNISNITNDTANIAKNRNMRLKISCLLQNKAKIKVSFRFPLNDTLGNYSFAGNVDTFDIKILNSFIENTSFISVKNGIVNKATFYVDVNPKYASGKMHLFYNNLTVNIIDTAASPKNLYTFVANTVIPGNNPKTKYGKLREGKIYFEKQDHKPVFNLWTKSVLSGVSYTLGFKSKQLKKHLKLSKRISRFIKKENKQTEKELKKTNNETENEQ